MPWIRMRWRQVGDPNAVSAESARGERVRRSLVSMLSAVPVSGHRRATRCDGEAAPRHAK